MTRVVATRPGRVLLAARRVSGLSQSEVSRRAGVAKSAISMYETGAREPGTTVFLRLLSACGCSLRLNRFSDEQLRRGRVFSDLLLLASELPHRWPGDDLQFPAGVWNRS